MGQEYTRVGVDIRPGVLSFSGLQKDIWDKGVDLADELKQGIIREMLERKLALCGVTRICLPQHSVAVPGHNLATLESRPDVLFDSFIAGTLTDLGLHFTEPYEDFLVSETVEGTGKTVEGCTVGEERV